MIKLAVLWAGPLIGLLAGLASFFSGGLEAEAAMTLGVAIWTASWWVFEPVPIPVTSLVPLAMFPLLGVLESTDVAAAYGHKLVLLLLGGFLLSKAMEKSGTHRRIALMMLNFTGGEGGKRLVLGFMLATAVLSMWISNTATTLMMLPIAVAVLQNSKDGALKVPLLLGIAYSASVGGIGTPIGTPPNTVMIASYQKLQGTEIAFLDWMKFGVPVSLSMLVVIWLWLTRKVKVGEVIELETTGAWRKEEVRTLFVFGMTALLWMTRTGPFGGWGQWVPGANDASVALLSAVLLFCLPSGVVKGDRLLDWKTANEIPWAMLVLMGAGLCLGTAFKVSGLSREIVQMFGGVSTLPILAVLLLLTLLVTFLTEMTSNTATTNVLMPILGALAVATDIDPLMLMLPAAMSASCAFMLPVATIPNAVVFGTGEVSIRQMAREGLMLNLFGVIVITGICYVLLS